MLLVIICFIRHQNAPEDPALRDIRQNCFLKAEIQLKGKWSKEKWKEENEKEKLPRHSGARGSPRGVAGVPWGSSGQGLADRAHPTTLARSRAATGHWENPSLGTRHLPGDRHGRCWLRTWVCRWAWLSRTHSWPGQGCTELETSPLTMLLGQGLVGQGGEMGPWAMGRTGTGRAVGALRALTGVKGTSVVKQIALCIFIVDTYP